MSASTSRYSSTSTVTSSKGPLRSKQMSSSNKAPARSLLSSKVPTKSVSSMSRPAASTITKAASSKTTTNTKKSTEQGLGENEAIKAFLRIRPAPEDTAGSEADEPYIDVINDTEVVMNPPKSTTAARARVYSSAAPTKYAFSRVFNSTSTSQADFFQDTTLPLVDELLQGQSGLIFTYGVTNSGKSYTVQGGARTGDAGILPRSMDTIFNSIEGLESESDIRPVGLTGVERAREEVPSCAIGVNPFNLPGMSKKLQSTTPTQRCQYEHDATKVKIDRNYRYSVWVSYVEVYNEKIFDLLDVAPPTTSSTPRSSTFGGGMTRSDSFRGSNWALASLANAASDSGPIYIQRRPLTLKNDIDAGGKYIAGLQEVRVHSAAEARELLHRGQDNRQVFGTMANRASSRSHGVFTVKIIREHAGEEDLSIACSTSRLSIVDLAGSERLGNTSVTGDRLKEAGSINKSLMCLGQCLETLRKNQARAMSFVPMPTPISSTSGIATAANTSSTRMMKKRPSIVPFRHSKLTELFQSFFTGEGRAVMIVNVNPFDTGFDENSHVMRFSASAKEVQTIRNPHQTTTSLSRFVHPSLRDLFNPGSSPAPSSKAKFPAPSSPTPQQKSIGSVASSLTSSFRGASPAKTPMLAPAKPSKIATKAATPPPAPSPPQEVTILEESDDGEDEQSDSFVDHLMVKYEEVRHQLYQSEKQCAQLEERIRQEMAEEMSRRLQEMEAIFTARLVQDSSMHDDFINKKLDLFGSSKQNSNAIEDSEIDDSVDEDEDVFVEDAESDEEVESTLHSKGQIKTVKENDEDAMNDTEKTGGDLTVEDSLDAPDTIQDSAGEVADSSNNSKDTHRTVKASKAASSAQNESDEEEDTDLDSSSDSESSEEKASLDEEDDSFDITAVSEESQEDSSFDAAPKRTSRGRQSKQSVAKRRSTAAQSTLNKKKAAPAKKTKSTTSSAGKSAANTRRSANGLPLRERSANISRDSEADQSSDNSIVITKATKSPKKKRLLSKKSTVDQDSIMDQIMNEQD